MENQQYPFINTPLPYAYDALEPYIDEKTMKLHHTKHLQTYIDNLNNALKNHPELQQLTLPLLIRSAGFLPDSLNKTIGNNAGGVFNHRFYFQLLTDTPSPTPQGTLKVAIEKTFGSYPKFQESFKQAALSVFGSGYAWLIKTGDKLSIVTTKNQDTPLDQNQVPILTIDVWEHAYYLKHYNMRANYIDNWFHVVNWKQAEYNFTKYS